MLSTRTSLTALWVSQEWLSGTESGVSKISFASFFFLFLVDYIPLVATWHCFIRHIAHWDGDTPLLNVKPLNFEESLHIPSCWGNLLLSLLSLSKGVWVELSSLIFTTDFLYTPPRQGSPWLSVGTLQGHLKQSMLQGSAGKARGMLALWL